MKSKKWDNMSLLRVEKGADSLLRISNNMMFAFITLFIFIPLFSIMRFYFEGPPAASDTFIDFIKRLSIWRGVVFLIFEFAGLALAGYLQGRALRMYDYIDNRRNKLEKLKAKRR
ncbi:hypothetical protein [Kangiella sp.]|uniref:hypothetical protein n=1 Tax=Kangiella sp. TaxID=1920245 RepID=UPI003A8D0A9C